MLKRFESGALRNGNPPIWAQVSCLFPTGTLHKVRVILVFVDCDKCVFKVVVGVDWLAFGSRAKKFDFIFGVMDISVHGLTSSVSSQAYTK